MANRSETPSTNTDTSQDYYALRSLGIQWLGKLGTDTWTDFNPSDPGITLLETLTYAITDLGYRTSFPIEDILAQAKLSQAEMQETSFPTVGQILPTEPVTLPDMRKLLVDQPGIANAWVEVDHGFSPVKGLRKVYLQPLEANLLEDEQHELVKQAKHLFWANRNMGTYLEEIQVLQPRKLSLNLDLVIQTGVIPEEVLAKVLFAIEAYLQSRVQFLTLGEMETLCEGDYAAVYEGPILQQGFLPDANLQPKLAAISPDDLIRTIRYLPCVQSVVSIQITQRVAPNVPSSDVAPIPGDGILHLTPLETPILDDLNVFSFQITQNRIPYTINLALLEVELEILQHEAPSSNAAGGWTDLPIPEGKFRNLEQFYSVRYDLPAIYQMRLGDEIALLSPQRQGEINQLAGFLSLFDQVLANYLCQLAHVYDLFSWSSAEKRTYFFQGLEYAVSNWVKLLSGQGLSSTNSPEDLKQAVILSLNRYQTQIAEMVETKQQFQNRRVRFLNHLLARFGRDLEAYVAQLPTMDREQHLGNYIFTAERLLSDYSFLSRRKGTGNNPRPKAQHPAGLSGLQQVTEGVLGFPFPSEKEAKVYQQFRLVDAQKISPQRVFGQIMVTTEDGSPIDLPNLIQCGIHNGNYQIVNDDAPNGEVTVWLYNDLQTDQPSRWYKFVNSFLTVDDALDAIRHTAELFRKYTVASERMIVVDHVLLKPFAENPVFGSRILDENGKTLLTHAGWYPQSAISMLADLSAANAAIIYDGENPSTAIYQFRILASQGGKPFPVFPQTGVPLPIPFPSTSVYLATDWMVQQFQSYLTQFDQGLLPDPTAMGTAIQTDFLANDLPSDYYATGKNTALAQWGRQAFSVVLSDWGNDFGPYPSVADALFAITSGNIQPTTQSSDPTQNITFTPEQILLGQWCNQSYLPTLADAQSLYAAVSNDLDPSKTPTAAFSQAAIGYLSAVGRSMGKAFLARFTPNITLSAAQLGAILPNQLGLTYPLDLETRLEGQLTMALKNAFQDQKEKGAAFLLKLWPILKPASPVLPGKNDSKSTASTDDKSNSTDYKTNTSPDWLTGAGRNLIGVWVKCLWPNNLTNPAILGELANAWVAAGSGEKASLPADSLGSITLGSFQEWLTLARTNAKGDSTVLGNALIKLSQVPTAGNDGIDFDFGKLGSSTLLKYLQDSLSITTPQSSNPQSVALMNAMGISPDNMDASLLPEGIKIMEFLANNLLKGKTVDPTQLGEAVLAFIKDFSPTASKTTPPASTPAAGTDSKGFSASKILSSLIKPAADKTATPAAKTDPPAPINISALAPVGAYSLDAFYQKQVVPNTSKKLTAATLLFTQYGSPTDFKSLDTYAQTMFTQAESVLSQPGNPDVGSLAEWVGSGLMAKWLSQAAPTKDEAGIGTALQTLANPVAIPGTLGADTQTQFSQAGQIALYFLLKSRWAWQLGDPLALGNALLSLIGTPLPPSAPQAPTLPSDPPSLPEPIAYFYSLSYQTPDGIPVEFRGNRVFESQADAEASIQSIMASIPQVNGGQLPFESVFHPTIGPVDLGQGQFHTFPYSNSFTVVLPDWPLRFQEPGFRDHLEQIMRTEAPAHLMPHFIWLRKSKYQVFEGLYQNFSQADLDDIARDLYARQITQFLLKNHPYPPIP